MLALLVLVGADLPVHCLRHEVAGAWTFHLSALGERTRCGHTSPDNSAGQPQINAADYPNAMQVTLDSPDMAMVDGQSGSWTMVYDEGFEVRSMGKTFFAFNKFDGSVSANGEIQNYVSDCGKTQVGWFQDGDQYGCFVAMKGAQSNLISTSVVRTEQPSTSSLFSDADVKPPTPEEALDRILAQDKAPALVQEAVVTQEVHQANVDKINARTGEKGWKAKVHEVLLNKTHTQLLQLSGLRRAGVRKTKEPLVRMPAFLQLSTHDARAQERIDGMPANFDWRNKDGKDYVQNPVNQGSCGSCYVVSSLSMMTARRRINEDNVDAEPFSVQVPLFCGEYNQGCDGGYPELVAKWSHDVALVPESCGRYDLSDQTCKVTCDANAVDKYKVGEYGYIGGYYGASKEANMMEEIYNRGPIAIAIEPQDDFMYYSHGVYEHASAVFDEWAKVDHAVLMTGWGEEDGKKYWRVQNSWGPDWGEAGTFRIRRGVDESAVEAQAIFATVEKTSEVPNLGIYA